MDSQASLFAHYTGLGWTVDVTSVRLVSEVAGVKKYDVNVVSPDRVFGTAQFVENGGVFTALGFWETPETTFSDRLTSYIRSMEGQGGIFAIVVQETFPSDSAAVVRVYMGAGDVTVSTFIVKERNNAFTYRLII